MRRSLCSLTVLGSAGLSLCLLDSADAWNAASDEWRRQMTVNQINQDAANRAQRASQPFFGSRPYQPSSASSAPSSYRSSSSAAALGETLDRISKSLTDYEDERRNRIKTVTVAVTRKETPQQLAARIRAEAQRGNAFMQWTLGRMYNSGVGLAKDPAQAVKWFRAGAEKGNADAQTSLGDMYYAGIGVVKDLAAAVQWWSKAAAQGHGVAAKNAGACYEMGWGVPPSNEKARDYYKIAADTRDPEAALWLGELYRDGKLGSPDKAAACPLFKIAAEQGLHAAEDSYAGCIDDAAASLVWLRKAADGGLARARFKLGMAMINGIGVPKDPPGGARLVVESAPGVEEDTKALLIAGTVLLQGADVKKDVVEAVRYYNMAAERNDPKGRQAISEVRQKTQGAADDDAKRGFEFLFGKGVARDEEKAFQILKEAAAAGNLSAMGMVGRMYHDGTGTKADPGQAALHWHMAALLGSIPAKRDYGVARFQGDGAEKDVADGLTWIQLAAADGDRASHAILGEVYEKGIGGVPVDLTKARSEYQQAADAGHEEAKKAIERLSGKSAAPDSKRD